jgi:KUP system potassium uptake protein
MTLWFVVLAVLGLVHIVDRPDVLVALSPHHALAFIWHNPRLAFVALGAVVLCVTGAEALYADMGHFGKRPIRLAWFGLAMPALVQLLRPGRDAARAAGDGEEPVLRDGAEWALFPLIGLATVATVIASQALITGAFSSPSRRSQLGYLPRLRILHTSVRETGQIYVPFVNWGCTCASSPPWWRSARAAGWPRLRAGR